MDAPLGLCGGNPLHSMHPALVLQTLEDVRPRDLEDHFLEPTQIRRAGIQPFHLPPLRFRIPRIHPRQVRRKQSGLLPAGPGSDFEDGVAGVRRVCWHQPAIHELLQACGFPFQSCDLFARHLGELGTRGLGPKEFAVFRQVCFRLEIGFPIRHEVLQSRVFAREFLRALRVLEGARIA